MPRRILIDGYNMIRTNPSGEALERSRGNAAAREWLAGLCLRAMRPGEQWHIVFDGDGAPECRDAGGARLALRYAAPQTADALLRDMAADAVACGIDCLLVSSDREVRAEGCPFQDSAQFYDYLLRHARVPAQGGSGAENIIAKLLAYLAECGHIQGDARVSSALREALRELLSCFAAESAKPQKIARAVESLLRDDMKLVPEPDTEKLIYRNLKHFFEKHTG